VGLILDFSVSENLILGSHRSPRFRKLVRLDGRRISEFARGLMGRFGIVASSEGVPVRYLSGGNQQRVVVARELSREPDLVIAAQPTMGLDVSATEFIRRELLRMRGEGKAILLVSSDLDEVLQLSDRIAVMYEGRFMGVGRPEDFTVEEIGLMMGGVEVR